MFILMLSHFFKNASHEQVIATPADAGEISKKIEQSGGSAELLFLTFQGTGSASFSS